MPTRWPTCWKAEAMKIRPQQDEPMERLAARLEGQRVAMLTLVEPGGELGSRPLTALEMDDQGSFWFFTSRRTMQPLVGEGAPANLAFSDEGHATYVSIAGRATLVDDPGLKSALWSAAARPFFPGGEHDPDLVLLRVKPQHAEIWDGPDSYLVRMAAMAASVVAGRPLGLGDKEEIRR